MSSVHINKILTEQTIAECRKAEENFQRDIEKKKQELRKLVGGKYGDIIATADSIAAMKAECIMINRILDNFRNKVAQLGSPLTDADKLPNTSPVSVSVCLLKLMADCHARIWSYLQTEQYAESASVYFLARQGKVELLFGESAEHVSVLFPFSKALISSLSSFESKISASAKTVLCLTENCDMVVNCMCALILINNATLLDICKLFLDLRRQYIVDWLKKQSLSSSVSITDVFLHVLKYCFITCDLLADICALYTSNEGSYRYQKTLGGYRNSVERWFKDEQKCKIFQSEFCTGGRPINPMFNNLKHSITDFSTCSLLEEKGDLSAAVYISVGDLRDCLRTWLTTIACDITVPLGHCFSSIISLVRMADIKICVLTEFSRYSATWNRLCQDIFSENVLLWTCLMDPAFSNRIKFIFSDKFDQLASAASSELTSCGSINSCSINCLSQHWSEQKSAPTGSSDKAAAGNDKMRLQPAVFDRAVAKFVQSLKTSVLADFDKFTSMLIELASTKHAVGVAAPDSIQAFGELLAQCCCANFCEPLALNIEQYLSKLPTPLSTGQIIAVFWFTVSYFYNEQLLQCVGNSISKRDELVTRIEQLTTRICAMWVEACCVAMSKPDSEIKFYKCSEQLASSYAEYALSWRQFTIMEESDAQNRMESSIEVPAAMSGGLQSALQSLFRLRLTHSGILMDKHFVELVFVRFAAMYTKDVLASLDVMLQRHVPVQQSFALQLWFDLRCLRLLLSRISPKSELRAQLNAVLSDINDACASIEGSHIDPFDFNVLVSHLEQNVQQYTSAVSNLYLTGSGSGKKMNTPAAASAVASHHNLLPLVFTDAQIMKGRIRRFTLLPAGKRAAAKTAATPSGTHVAPDRVADRHSSTPADGLVRQSLNGCFAFAGLQ